MWNAIIGWIGNNYPLILIILVVAVIVWNIAKVYYSRFKKLEHKISDLSCKEHKGILNAHADTFNRIMDELTAIRTYIITKNPRSANIFSQKASPRKLNTEGIKLFQDISGTDFLHLNKDELMRLIDDKQPKTALDVEVAANEILLENLNSDIFNDLKLWVYNSPMRKLDIKGEKIDYAITMNDVCFVLSIPLRDMYLDDHPEIIR